MKYLIFYLFISISAFAQTTNISVVSAEKVNVVYRGIANPIKIAVPGAKSFTATAPGLKALDSLGNYKLSPGSGNEVIVTIEAVMGDGSILKEEKVFRVKGLPGITGTFNQDGCRKCSFTLTKDELITGEIGVEISDFFFIDPIKATKFSMLIYTDEKKLFDIEIDGFKVDRETADIIRQLKPGCKILIYKIRSDIKNYFAKSTIIEDPSPISIILED